MNALPPPMQPQEPFGEHPDPAVDSLLRELLGEDTPPNLVSKADAIHRAARNQGNGSNLFSHDQLLAAANLARKEIATSQPSRAQPHPRSRSASRSNRHAQWGALALAASLVGIIAVYPFWRASEGKKPLVQQKNYREFPPIGSGSKTLFGTEDRSGEGEPSNKTTKSSNPKASKPNKSLAQGSSNPSEPVNPQPNVEAKSEAASPKLAQSSIVPSMESAPLRDSSSDQQIIAVIDQQLEHLWNRMQVKPTKTTDRSALEDRLSQVLIGRLPTDAERAWGRKAGSGSPSTESLKALTRRWIDSEEFDRHWGRALSDYYLDGSMAIDDKSSLTAFDVWLQESIQRNEAIGAIEGRLIASDLNGGDASSFWMRRWTAAGKKSTGGLLASNGKSPAGRGADQWHALETLALQTARLSGRAVLPVAEIATETIASDVLLGNAAAFASVFVPDKPRASEKWRDLYVADIEGKVTLVPPTLPDGKPIARSDDPRTVLAQWFQDSPQARGAVIDFVWGRLVGQPLVPRIGLADTEGFEERKDLLEFLAAEAQAQRASLRQVVSWIVMASPLYVESKTIESKEFVELDPSSLASAQLQMRLFATYPGTRTTTPVAARLSDLSRWLKPSEVKSLSVLAQPATDQRGIGKQAISNSPESLAWPADRVHVELSILHPYARVRDASTELANSPLDWDAVVDRVFLACLSRYPSSSERKQANELLVWSDGDRRAASVRLINTLLGYL